MKLRRQASRRDVVGTALERCDQLFEASSAYIQAVLDTQNEVAIQALAAGMLPRVDITDRESILDYSCDMASATNLEEMGKFLGVPDDEVQEKYAKTMTGLKAKLAQWKEIIDSGEEMSDTTRALYNMYTVMQQLGYLDLTR